MQSRLPHAPKKPRRFLEGAGQRASQAQLARDLRCIYNAIEDAGLSVRLRPAATIFLEYMKASIEGRACRPKVDVCWDCGEAWNNCLRVP